MTFRSLALASAIAASLCGTALAQTVEAYKDPNCGCCEGWIAHMRANGFDVQVTDADGAGMAAAKARAGTGGELQSCHTAFVEGYAIEGHVPAEDVVRLLAERPHARGLAAPGMPAGSPGMEGAGHEPYQVLLVGYDGTTRTFASH